MAKFIDDQNFPTLDESRSTVEALWRKLDSEDLIALYVVVEAAPVEWLFLQLSEQAYLLSGHEEPEEDIPEDSIDAQYEGMESPLGD